MLPTIATVLLSLIATAIAVLSYRRAMANQLPVVQFKAASSNPFDTFHWIRIDNPTRRTIILTKIRFLQPDSKAVKGIPIDIGVTDKDGHWRRIRQDPDLLGSERTRDREIALEIPPGIPQQIRLNIIPVRESEDCLPRYDLHIKLYWTHQLPFPDRFCIPNSIIFKADNLLAQRRAASTRSP